MPEPTLKPMEETARGIGEAIGHALDQHAERHPRSPRIGFTLMLFDFGSPPGFMTYISSADRSTMLEAMEEFLDKHDRPREGRAAIESLIAEVDGADNGYCQHCRRPRYYDLTGHVKPCTNPECWSVRIRKALNL